MTVYGDMYGQILYAVKFQHPSKKGATMFQPDFFEDRIHPVHFLKVEPDGSTVQFDIQVSEQGLAFSEEVARLAPGICKVWFDGAKYNEVHVFTK